MFETLWSTCGPSCWRHTKKIEAGRGIANMQTVVNMRSTKEYDVRIDRRTEFGNPFKIGEDGTREEVVEKHMMYLRKHPDLVEKLATRLKETGGTTLGCWCAPASCHGDNYRRLMQERGYF